MMGAVWLSFWLVPGLTFSGDWLALLVFAVLIGLANAVVIPLLKLLALPLRIVTLGLATLAINIGVMILVIIIGESMDLGVSSDGFVSTLLGALLLTVLSSVVSWLVKD